MQLSCNRIDGSAAPWPKSRGSVPRSCNCVPLVVVWEHHVDDYVTALGVSHDGELVVVGTGSGRLYGFETTSGAVAFDRHVHPGGVLAASFCPTAPLLATSGQDGYARLFDASGAVRAELSGGAAWVEQLSWARSGERLATASGRSLRAWTRSGAPLWEAEPFESSSTGIAWSADEKQLAAASRGGVRIVDASRGALIRSLPKRASLVSLVWSPDDAVIACGAQERSVHFWRLFSGKRSQMSGFTATPRFLAWDHESELLAATGDPAISIWRFDEEGPEGRQPTLLKAHEALCTVLAFHRAGPWLASGGDDGNVFVWEPRTASFPLARARLQETVTRLTWIADERLLLATDASGLVRVMRVAAEP